MTAKHMPGPWLTSNNMYRMYDSTALPESDRTWKRNVRTQSLDLVATAHGRTQEECKANAQLLEAAPDLLAAAKHAAMEWRLHGQLTDSCRVLEAAIKKAEGR